MKMTECFVKPTEEDVRRVWQDLEVTELNLKASLDYLKEWLRQQPHLPDTMDSKRMETLYINSKCSMERTKKAIDLYFTIRTKMSSVMQDRDPKGCSVQKAMTIGKVFPMPKLTDDGYRVLISTDIVESSLYDFHLYLKMFLITMEQLLSDDYNLGIIIVFDWSVFGLAHIASMNLNLIRDMELSLTSAYRARIKGIYGINATTSAEAALNLMLPLISSKISKRIHVFSKNSTKLFNSLPREYIPDELGGTAGSIKSIWGEWANILYNNRDWYIEQDKIMSDESKRPADMQHSEMFGVEGSFKKLVVD